MSVEVLAILLTIVAHIGGAAFLVWLLLDGDQIDWRSLRPSDDGDDDDGGSQPPRRPGPVGPPLADARPAATRLREPGRLADDARRPARRPRHDRPQPRTPVA